MAHLNIPSGTAKIPFRCLQGDAGENTRYRRSRGGRIPSLKVNSLLPHRLAALCRAMGARLMHVSTDRVFSGRKGNYTEENVPDAPDLYGRTKLLGEVAGEDFGVVHGPPRPGDVRHCTADATRLRGVLGVSPSTHIPENLKEYYAWMVSDPVSIEKVLSVKTGRA